MYYLVHLFNLHNIIKNTDDVSIDAMKYLINIPSIFHIPIINHAVANIADINNPMINTRFTSSIKILFIIIFLLNC